MPRDDSLGVHRDEQLLGRHPELFLELGNIGHASLVDEFHQVGSIPPATLHDKEGVIAVLRIVSHEFAEQEVRVAKPVEIEVPPIILDFISILAPLVSQDDLVFDEEMTHEKPGGSESLVRLFQCFPKVRGTLEFLGLAEPQHDVDIETLRELLRRGFKPELEGGPAIKGEFNGLIQPPIQFGKDANGVDHPARCHAAALGRPGRISGSASRDQCTSESRKGGALPKAFSIVRQTG